MDYAQIHTGDGFAVTNANPLPVIFPGVGSGLINAELRATPVDVYVKQLNRVRCQINFQGTSSVAEAILTMTQNLGGSVVNATSFTATSGKRIKLTGIGYTLKAGAAAAAFSTLHMRSRAGGPTVITSASIYRAEFGLTASVAGSCMNQFIPIPDGMEFSGAESFGFTLACQAVTNVHSLTVFGYEYTP